MVSDERLGSGSSSDHLNIMIAIRDDQVSLNSMNVQVFNVSTYIHHRRLNLEKTEIVQKSTHVRDDLSADVKLVAHVLIDDQV